MKNNKPHSLFVGKVILVCSSIFLLFNFNQAKSKTFDSIQTSSWFTTESGCSIFIENEQINISVDWNGSCINGKSNGDGEEIIKIKSQFEIYNGIMKNGMRDGHGSLKFSDGRNIEADFKNGVMQDYVIYSDSTGFKYKGKWAGLLPEGIGVGDWKSTSHYEGVWHLGKPNGKGKLIYPNSEKYEGYFVNGLREGLGILSSNDGSQISGEWKQNIPDGIVTSLSISNETKYEGHIKNMRRDGDGEFYFKNGDIYVGNWSNNLPSGQGKLIESNGITYSGYWKSGCLFDGVSYIARFVSLDSCKY